MVVSKLAAGYSVETAIWSSSVSAVPPPNTVAGYMIGTAVLLATLPSTTTSPFSLQDDGVKTIINVVPNTARTVSEDNPSPLYALTDIDCSASTVPAANRATNTTNVDVVNGPPARSVKFSIAAGETLDCTFTNTKQKQPSTINTAPWIYPNDYATVGPSTATGTVTFKLFGATTSPAATALANCLANGTQGLLYSEDRTLPGSGTNQVSTNNYLNAHTPDDSVKIESTTRVYWRVEYGGSTSLFGRVSNCEEYIDATLHVNDTAGGTAP